MTTHADFYSLPRLYDILHAPGTAGDVRLLRRLRRLYAPAHEGADVWLEPACGTARYLRHAARLGVRCVGFDIEPRMIAYAKRAQRAQAARARLFVARMEDFAQGRRIPAVTLAFNLINTIRHLADDRAMDRHLRSVAGVLRPGGVYVVGLSLCAYGLESITEDVWKGSREGTRVSQVVQYLPPAGSRGEAARAERVISHLTVRSGRGATARETHIDSTYVLRGYNLAQWREVVARAGLEIAAVTDGAGVAQRAREPGYYLFVLRRAGDVTGQSRSGPGVRRTRGPRSRP